MRRVENIGLAALVAAVPWLATAAGSGAKAAAPAGVTRELRVPADDLGMLLQNAADRVLLDRAAYEALCAQARRTAEELPPAAAVVGAAEYDIAVEQDRAIIKGGMTIEVLRAGLHAVRLDIAGMGLREAGIDGASAPVGRGDDGALVLFVEGPGVRRLEWSAVTPVRTSAAQQSMAFRLPESASSRLRIRVPGDVEVRGGAAVSARVFDSASQVTTMELALDGRDVKLAMSLNSRLKRMERAVSAQSVVVNEMLQSCERLHATVSLEVLHQAVRDFRFELPSGFEVTRVESPQLARWETAVDGGKPILRIFMREEVTGRTTVQLSALRTGSRMDSWEFPQLMPLDVVAHVSVLGLLLEERLRLEEISAPGMIPIDRSVLLHALPATVLEAAPGEARVRPLAAYYAPDAGRSVTAVFSKPPARLQVTGNTVVSLRDDGLIARGGLSLVSLEERVFSLDLLVPAGWEMRDVKDASDTALKFEQHEHGAGKRIHIVLSRPAQAAEEFKVFFVAAHVPAGWYEGWTTNSVALPSFAVEGAATDEGAIGVEAGDDMHATVALVENMAPLDENEKAGFGLSGAATSLAYRYESRPYRIEAAIERISPRLTAETFSFFRVEQDVVAARMEVVYSVTRARARKVSLLLPEALPSALSIAGAGGTTVKEYSAAGTDGGLRLWNVRLAEPAAGKVHIAVDCRIPVEPGAVKMTLAPVRADGVAYQSGYAAVEGTAELDVSVTRHPRKADVGELAQAVYQPGRRLLGAYGFVGEPDPLEIAIVRRDMYAVPSSVVQDASLATDAGANGTALFSFHCSLRNKEPFIEVRLPAGSELWTALVDGKPSRPQNRDGALLVGMPAGKAATSLTVVYRGTMDPLGFWTKTAAEAPALFIPSADGAGGSAIPVSGLRWSLRMPTGYRVIQAGGTLTSDDVKPVPVAPVRFAQWLYKAAGGTGFGRGLIGACAAPFQRAAMRARMVEGKGRGSSYEIEYMSGDVDESGAVSASGPAATVMPPALPQAEGAPDITFGLDSENREARGAPDGEMVVRMYDWDGDVGALRGESDARGVTWPSGSSVQHMKEANKLIVANTPENLKRLESLLAELPPPTDMPQVVKSAVIMKKIYGSRLPGARGSLLAKDVSGSAGVEIALSGEGPGVTFRSLGERPKLELTVVNSRRLKALGLAASLAVLLTGLGLIGESPARKTRFVVWSLLASTLVPAVPGLVGLAYVLNGVFYAACGLLAIYGVAGIFSRIKPNAKSAVAGMLLLAVLSAGTAARAADGKYVVEMVPPEPVTVPSDALLVPYTPGDDRAPDRVLVPLAAFRELWTAANPAVAAKPPVSYALAGASYSAELAAADDLALKGSVTVCVFADEGADVRLPVDGGILQEALLDGKPARLRAAQDPAAAPEPALFIPGPGIYRLDLTVRMKVTRQGGWRRASGRIPAAVATALDLGVPQARTEVLLQGVQDRGAYRTDRDGTVIATAVDERGYFGVQWRPVVDEGEVDRSLTAESSVLLDVQEDRLYEVWKTDLFFRRGERGFFQADVPAGCLIEKVAGPNVRGWELDAGAGAGGAARLTVKMLKPSQERETFTIVLWRARQGDGDKAALITAPVIVVPEAVRHTGRITLRHSPLLALRVMPGEGVRRTDLAAGNEIAALAAGTSERPLGMVAFQTYDCTGVPFELAIECEPTRLELKAAFQTILRVAERKRAIETRVEVTPAERPLYELVFDVPPELTVKAVMAPGVYEWSVPPSGKGTKLLVRFAGGIRERTSLVIKGELARSGKADEVVLPRLALAGAREQEGDIAVLGEPAFDIKAIQLENVEAVLPKKLHAWLRPEQRELVRLALHHGGGAYSGRLQVTGRQPDVSCVTVSNVRVTDRAIEETVLLSFTIRNAGVRELSFLLPAHLADARISVPLLRRKTIMPVEGSAMIMARLELQDEVMNEVKVLVELDRLLVQGREETVTLPEIITGRADRRYLALETAGRDEVIAGASEGLEQLGRQQKEWAAVAALFRGGSARTFVSSSSGPARLRYSTRERKAVETAGARIGLGETVLFVDASGAYRGRQTYQVDNQTEQFLEITMPAGAALWAAEVAGEAVKPVKSQADGQGTVRIPLVKTAAGDLDYSVVLHYGGIEEGIGSVSAVEFPLMRVKNIGVELSQVELRLPSDRKWFRFDGTMRLIKDEADFSAGYLRYQGKLAQRLIRTLQYGNAFEKARSASNLRSLKTKMEYAQKESQSSAYRGGTLEVEMSNVSGVLKDAEKTLAEQDLEQAHDSGDNRGNMNEFFVGQKNDFTKNVVLNGAPNWSHESVTATVAGGVVDSKTQPGVSREAFNAAWFDERDLGNKAAQEPEKKKGGKADGSDDVAGVLSDKLQLGQQFQNLDMQRQVHFMNAVPQEAVPLQDGEQGRVRRQVDNVSLYASRLRERAGGGRQAESVNEAVGWGSVGAGGVAAAGEPVDRLQDGQVKGDETAGFRADTGLASVSIGLPSDDAIRWTPYRFTTPRGDIRMAAWTCTSVVPDALRRVGLAIVAALVAAGLPLVLRRRSPESRRRIATFLTMAGAVGLLVGVFPLASVVLVALGISMRASARRAERRAAA